MHCIHARLRPWAQSQQTRLLDVQHRQAGSKEYCTKGATDHIRRGAIKLNKRANEHHSGWRKTIEPMPVMAAIAG